MAPSGDHGVSGHPDVLCSKREKEMKLGITRTSHSWTGIPSMQGPCANQQLNSWKVLLPAVRGNDEM